MTVTVHADDGPNKPLLVYDGACGYCLRWIHRWQRTMGDRIDYAPFQDVADQFPTIPRERFEQAVHLIEPNGRSSSGAEAVFRALSLSGRRRWPLAIYRFMPGAAHVTEAAYRFVANHRSGVSRLTDWLWGPDPGPASYILTRWLFVRLIALVYFIAFVSLACQVQGLIGSQGILPAAEFLERAYAAIGSEAYWRLPTLAWFACSDQALVTACWAGAGIAVLVFFRVVPAVGLAVLWVLYLSLFHVGQSFLSFQWDLLLLETGLVAIFISSWKLWPRLKHEPPPPRMAMYLAWWLLFRLMFASGVVKLLDDGPTNRAWHELTALNYHYETQCIPNAVAWYAHQLAPWFQKFSVAAMFGIEIVVPFLIFLPRRIRLLAFFPLALLQLLIILTGNYNFFNVLTIALCCCLLDDAFLRRFFPRAMRDRAAAGSRTRSPFVQRWAATFFALAALTVSAVWMGYTLRRDRSQGLTSYLQHARPTGNGLLAATVRGAVDASEWLFSRTRPLASINTYGLFRNMTIKRPEIIIEGSNDGRTWLAYEFKWKPGDVMRRPSQVAPHQPRLDWQMWFAALGNYRQNPWFVNFMERLLEGQTEVLALLRDNPFPDEPPRFVRAMLYDYHFTTWQERRDSGAWWRRELIGPYLPKVPLQSFRR